MPIALDPKEPFDYVLIEEQKLPPEEQTVCILRGLTIAEETSLNNKLVSSPMGGDEMNWNTGNYQLATLKMGWTGWRNFKDKDGAEIPCAIDAPAKGRKSGAGGISDKCLDMWSSAHRTEIANAIIERGKVTSEEGN